MSCKKEAKLWNGLPMEKNYNMKWIFYFMYFRKTICKRRNRIRRVCRASIIAPTLITFFNRLIYVFRIRFDIDKRKDWNVYEFVIVIHMRIKTFMCTRTAGFGSDWLFFIYILIDLFESLFICFYNSIHKIYGINLWK